MLGKKRTREFEDRSVEIMLSEKWKKINWATVEFEFQKKRIEKNREWAGKKIFDEIIANKITNLMK